MNTLTLMAMKILMAMKTLNNNSYLDFNYLRYLSLGFFFDRSLVAFLKFKSVFVFDGVTFDLDRLGLGQRDSHYFVVVGVLFRATGGLSKDEFNTVKVLALSGRDLSLGEISVKARTSLLGSGGHYVIFGGISTVYGFGSRSLNSEISHLLYCEIFFLLSAGACINIVLFQRKTSNEQMAFPHQIVP